MRLKASVLASILVLACALSASGALAAEEIIVSAAASLTESFTEAKAAFEKAHPGLTVVTNFAASGPLLQQIEQGAPVDVFASADQETMDKAQAKGLIVPASRGNFTANALVLVVPAGAAGPAGPAGPFGLKGLAAPTVARLAIGNPESVPVGRYARESLTAAGLWEAVQGKLILGNSVKQTLDYVARGEVDAGVVFATDAQAAGAKVKVVEELGGHKPIAYPAAVVAGSAKKEAARQFIDFVTGPTGQAILAKHGFKPVAP